MQDTAFWIQLNNDGNEGNDDGQCNVGLLVSYLDDEYVEEVTHPHLSREYNGPQWPANPIG